MKTSESRYSKCMYFISSALARKMEKLAQQNWKKFDLSPSHAYLLMAVLEQPGLQPSSLSAELSLTPSTITRLIEKLEEKMLVERMSEGKNTSVYPTEKAIKLLPQLKECSDNFHHCYCKILGTEESRKLVMNMNKIADKL